VVTSFLDQVACLLVAAVALVAAWSDLRYFRIPNTLPLLLLALYPLHLAMSGIPVDWQGGLSLALILLLGGFALFAAGLLGAGDVKLLAAAGLWAARDLGGELVLITTLAGGALALTLLTPWGQLALAAAQSPEAVARKVAPGVAGITRMSGQAMPYGVAIAIALLVVAAQRAHQL